MCLVAMVTGSGPCSNGVRERNENKKDERDVKKARKQKNMDAFRKALQMMEKPIETMHLAPTQTLMTY